MNHPQPSNLHPPPKKIYSKKNFTFFFTQIFFPYHPSTPSPFDICLYLNLFLMASIEYDHAASNSTIISRL